MQRNSLIIHYLSKPPYYALLIMAFCCSFGAIINQIFSLRMFEIFYNFAGINKQLFIAINDLTNVGSIPVILKYLSSIFFIANFAVIYVVVCGYFYYRTKNAANKKEYFLPIYHELSRIGICYAVFGCTFAALKFSINLPRPFCSLELTEFSSIASTINERCLSSFPSAHTGLCILAAYFLWPYLGKKLKMLAIIITLAVATSRITLAMHYPADILYSVIVTMAVIIVGNILYKTLKKKIITPVGGFIFKITFC